MRIVVSGGGTAGHVSPVLATVDALRRHDSGLQVLYVGQAGGIEAGLARAAGLRFVGVAGGKYRRDASQGFWSRATDLPTFARNLRDLVLIGVGTLQCIWQIGRFRPNVVFNKVGPAGLPVGLAARFWRVPMVIHEPDVVPGLANRILGRWAAQIAVGFPVQSYRQFPAAKLVFTGTPVQALLPKATGTAARKALCARLGLRADRALAVVTGGSQGAVALNTALMQILPQLLAFTQVYHLTGQRDAVRVAQHAPAVGEGYHARDSLPLAEMQQLLAAADVVVARAGANTIAELAALGKPAILVPNHEAAAHQLANAAVLQKAAAALVVQDTDPNALLEAISRVLTSQAEQRRLSTHISAFAHPEAAERLAQLIRQVARS